MLHATSVFRTDRAHGRAHQQFRDLLDRPIAGVNACPSADLTNMTTMKMRARASMLAEVNDVAGMAELLARSRAFEWPLVFLGGGANTLFATSFLKAIVVRLGAPFKSVDSLGGNLVWAGAGAPLPKLMNESKRMGLMGLEFLFKVPGKVGGGLAGNAGAGGWGLCDYAEQVMCMTHTGRIVKLNRGDFRFGYRYSELRELVILGATFRLRPLDALESEKLVKEYDAKKKGQPFDIGSSGCVFKNPIDRATRQRISAGKLIDESGLKGYSIRGAAISENHANFMVNKGDATGEDFLALITLVQDVVRERTGYELEMEVHVEGGPLAHQKMAA